MGWDELGRMATDDNARDREKWIGIYIGILAVLLAICSTGGGNAAKNATLKNIEAADTWAFFQAKNMRRHVLRVAKSDLEIRLLAEPQMPDAAKAAITAKIADYAKQDEVLTKDPGKEPAQREGLDQLFEKAKGLEEQRDLALKQDPYFDYAEACLQIAIVLAGVAILSSGNLLLVISGILGVLGALFTFNGFTLFAAIPFIG